MRELRGGRVLNARNSSNSAGCTSRSRGKCFCRSFGPISPDTIPNMAAGEIRRPRHGRPPSTNGCCASTPQIIPPASRAPRSGGTARRRTGPQGPGAGGAQPRQPGSPPPVPLRPGSLRGQRRADRMRARYRGRGGRGAGRTAPAHTSGPPAQNDGYPQVGVGMEGARRARGGRGNGTCRGGAAGLGRAGPRPCRSAWRRRRTRVPHRPERACATRMSPFVAHPPLLVSQALQRKSTRC
ncbi:hypothetical protein JOF59_005405 [Streptomyces clavifer]|uniref:Uncharacterized protein n=1 Tax=Streptomyces clavifer TaxID=68188 RepID=A0ABS4VGF3_9ACTN|nr:hypothetical protein [Streptomyces clavifer]